MSALRRLRPCVPDAVSRLRKERSFPAGVAKAWSELQRPAPDHADHGDGRRWSRCEHFRDPLGPFRQGRICTFRSVSLRAESARRRHEAVRPPPLSALKCRSLSCEEVLGDWAEGERGQILQHLYLFALTVPY